MPQDTVGILPPPRVVSEQCCVAGPFVPLEGIQIGHEVSAQWVEMDVAEQLEEVRLLFGEDRLESALKEIADPVVAIVECGGIATQQPLHGTRERDQAGARQEVKVVGQKRPRVDAQVPGVRCRSEAVDEVVAIDVIGEDRAAFDTPSHDVVQSAGSVEPRTARHDKDNNASECI